MVNDFAPRPVRILTAWGFLFLAFLFSVSAIEQCTAQGDATEEELNAAQYDQLLSERLQLQWQKGPTQVRIGQQAEIELPVGFRFLEKQGTHTLLKAFENFPEDSDIGLFSPVESTNWFVVFSFDDIGYVKDDEKDSIDKEALYESFRLGTEAGNEMCRSQGIAETQLAGWAVEPYYNSESNSIEWGLKFRSEGEITLNYFMKRLGRRGVLSCNLVVDPADFDEVMPQFREVMKNLDFQQGQKYAEFRAGDMVAEYGLTALVAGGALAVAAKSGLLGKLWKVIVFAVLAGMGVIKKFFGSGEKKAV